MTRQVHTIVIAEMLDTDLCINDCYGVRLQFFAFAATAVYAVDTFFQFRAWRTGQTEMVTTTTTTTTNTQQSSNVEAGKSVY